MKLSNDTREDLKNYSFSIGDNANLIKSFSSK